MNSTIVMLVHVFLPLWLLLTAKAMAQDESNATANNVVKTLDEQVDEMLQELRNQNQAIFKQAGYSRILSQKVSEMTEEMKLVKAENVDLKQKMKLLELKSVRKFKKIKGKISDVSGRLDLCKCPEIKASDSKDDKLDLDDDDDDDIESGDGFSYNDLVPKAERGWRRNRKQRGKKKRRRNKSNRYSNTIDSFYRPAPPPPPPPPPPPSSYPGATDAIYGSKSPPRKNYDFSLTNTDHDHNWEFEGSNQIFITSGSKNTSEILDVSQGYNACLRPADYPLRVQGAVGTFIDGRPMVCGGRSSIEDYYNDCYYYNVNNDSWSHSKPMIERRFQATAVMLTADRWWITGGFSGDYVYNTTEIYNPETGFQPGPNLPEVTFQHCLVKFNATHLFAVGGFPYNNNAWIMDFEEGTWTPQRKIPHLRDAPHCAVIQRLNGKVEIVVTGGSLPGSELSTEIFSISDNRWRSGPNLPQAIIYGVSIQYRNALLILGGRAMGGDLEELDTIFEYDSTKELWARRDKRLMSRRTSFVAIPLPNYLSCTNNFKPRGGRTSTDRIYGTRPRSNGNLVYQETTKTKAKDIYYSTEDDGNRFYGSFFN